MNIRETTPKSILFSSKFVHLLGFIYKITLFQNSNRLVEQKSEQPIIFSLRFQALATYCVTTNQFPLCSRGNPFENNYTYGKCDQLCDQKSMENNLLKHKKLEST